MNNNDVVVKTAEDVDSFLYEYLKNNDQLDPLNFFSIVLGRLTNLSQVMMFDDSFLKLIKSIPRVVEENSNSEKNNFH